MKSGHATDQQDLLDSLSDPVQADFDSSISALTNDADNPATISSAAAIPSLDPVSTVADYDSAALAQNDDANGQPAADFLDAIAPQDGVVMPAASTGSVPATFAPLPASPAIPTAAESIAVHTADVSVSNGTAIDIGLAHTNDQAFHAELSAAMPPTGGGEATAGLSVSPTTTAAVAPINMASLANPAAGFHSPVTSASIGTHGATAAQVQQALDDSGISVNGTGIKIGVLSDSFNDLGGAAADEADGALPTASNIQVIKDLASGGTDEGRAMMQVIHDIAPGASMAFYTADQSEQDFANGILALAAAGCKVICDDVHYFDEPFFQNGVVAQAIQTVEAEGVTYVTAAGNEASNAYQAAWTRASGTFDGQPFTDAESFGGSLAQTITVTASSANPVRLLLEWNLPYGQASFNSGQAPDIDIFVFHNGSLIGQATNASVGEPNNPFTGVEFTASGTYQIVISNNFGPDPGLIKEVLAGDGLPVSISGANAGTVVGHALTPGALTAGAVNAADTAAFGFSTPLSESFSSSGAGAELLFANNGTALPSPQLLNPVAVSSVDNIATTLSGGLGDFYGTSAASASLAGVAALILAANPSLTAAQVEHIMQETAVPMANSAVSGAGLVQVDPALAAAFALESTVVEAVGSTELAQVGNNFYLFGTSSGIGPELKIGGAVTTGEFGSWTPIAAEQTASGYDVAWRIPGTDQYTVWSTDSSGNDLGNIIPVVSGSSTALESLETSFHQDLNGDGIIGLQTTVIEAIGSTELAQVGNNYYLYSTSSGTGPELKIGGAVTTGEFGAWTPIAAEQTASGYDVAWRIPGTDQYTVWSTDSSGNDLGNIIPVVSGSSTGLESLETSFHQDLNGDGIIGLQTTVIEAIGSTELAQVGNNYYLYSTSNGTGPELKIGAAVTTGEFGAWTPIAAEQTASGYDVAWRIPGTDQYTVWSTDSSGNDIGNIIPVVSGNSTALESLETSFHQDLNGDGIIGLQTTVIEAVGSTELAQVGNNYYLYSTSSGTGPELKIGGAVTTGEFGAWTPIAAEQTASGYDVAWKIPGSDQYTAWSTDSTGNFITNIIPVVSGSSTELESLETSFHQDLNGDGTIGIPASTGAATLELAGASSNAVTFTASPGTLTLDTPSAFTGQIVGFTGDGTTAGSDRIDLRNMNYSSVHSSYDSSTGVLDISDGTTTAELKFAGTYAQDNFKFAADGSGGTIVYGLATSDPSSHVNESAGQVANDDTANLVVNANQESFVFAPHFGQVTIASFDPANDTVQINPSIFADMTALLAATHDDGHGNVVITDAAHDTMTIQHVTAAQLLAHQSDFHFV